MIATIVAFVLEAVGVALKAYSQKEADDAQIAANLRAALVSAADILASSQASHEARKAELQSKIDAARALGK